MFAGLSPTLAAGDLLSHVLPHTVFEIGGLTVTNHMFMALTAAVVVLLVFLYVSARVRVAPGSGDVESHLTAGRLPQMFEVICVYLRENMARPALGSLTDRYIPYIWSTFFFVLFMNLLGLIPIGPVLAVITGNEAYAHISGTATGNVMITGAMATVSLIMIVFIGIRHAGVDYFKHFCPMEVTSIGMLPIAAVVTFFEAIGLIIKCVVLAMRLFGNMLAGHLVIAALIGLTFLFNSYFVGVLSLVGAVAISLFEIFVAFLQAFIFTFLTVLFIAAGVSHHGDEHEDHGEHVESVGPAHAAVPEQNGPTPPGS